MQQSVSLGHIVDVGSSADDSVHQGGISIDPDMRLHPKVPLVALFGLVHLGVSLAREVLCRAGRSNQSGIDHRAGLKQQAVGSQFGIDDLQNLRA